VNGFALERCRRCGMVFVNPQYPNDPLLGQYDHADVRAQIDVWARITTPTMLADYDRMLRELEAALPGRGRLLDFGCGPCYFLERAVRNGWDAHGVEVGAWSREAAAARGVSDRLFLGLLAEQKFPDGHFDVVYSNQVFEHLARPREDLRELRRVLRPGGVLYLNVPNYHRLPVMADVDDFVLDMPMAHVNYFSPRTLGRLVGVLRLSTYGGLKWENLLGRPIRSEVVDAFKPRAEAPAACQPTAAEPARRPFLARTVMALVKALAYRWAKLGLTLELFARRV
jgi:SAM-dependent methyltransferase